MGKFMLPAFLLIHVSLLLSHGVNPSDLDRTVSTFKRFLAPRALIEQCTPDQQVIINDTLDHLKTLSEAGSWASDPNRSPAPRTRLDNMQRQFAWWFSTNEVRYRRLVQQRFNDMQKAVNGRRTRQRVVIRCDDPIGMCLDSGRVMYEFIREPGGRKDIVICARFYYISAFPADQQLLDDNYRHSDRTSLLFDYFAHNRLVWNPPAINYLPDGDHTTDIAVRHADVYQDFARRVYGDYMREVQRVFRQGGH